MIQATINTAFTSKDFDHSKNKTVSSEIQKNQSYEPLPPPPPGLMSCWKNSKSTGKAWFPYSLCGSLWVAEGRTVLGETVKDSWKTKWKHKTVSDCQRPIKPHKDWVAEGRWDRNKLYSSDPERPLVKTNEKTLSDRKRLIKTQQSQRPSATHKDHQRLYRNQA